MAVTFQQALERARQIGSGRTTANFDLYLPNVDTSVSKSTPTYAGAGNTANTLRVVGKELMKPVGIAATTVEQAGKSLGRGELAPLKEILPKSGRILAGKEENSFTKILSEQPQFQYEPTTSVLKNFMGELPAVILGTTMDILGDPLTYLGGGLTRQGMLASKLTSLAKAGEKIVPGSKLANQILKSGYTEAQLKLGTTKAEQAALGQRSLLTFGGKSIVPGKANVGAYNALSYVNDLVTGTKPGDKARQLLSTKTTNADFNLLVSHYKSLGDYRRATMLENARELQKSVKKMSANQIRDVGDYLEKNIIPKDDSVKILGDKLKAAYEDFLKLENELGITTKEVESYAPRVKVPTKQAIKDFFREPRIWSSKLANVEGRGIVKVVNEAGEEMIGTAKKLGLKQIDDFRGLGQELTSTQFKSLKQIEDTLANWGFTLKFKNQPWVRSRGTNGYFSWQNKQLVIASGGRNLENVLSTMNHEISHAADFQTNGAISMLETYAGGKTYVGEAMSNAKTAIKSEWVGILKSRGISQADFKAMSSHFKEYHQKPTELLSRAFQTYVKDPELAARLFPKTTKALEVLQKKNHGFLFDLISPKQKPNGMPLGKGRIYQDSTGDIFKEVKTSADEINESFLQKFFETNPAIQYAHRGISHAKAITGREFLNEAKKFSTAVGVESTAPELKGLKFSPEIARVIDSYIAGIKPEELRVIYRSFSAVQNWWKGQALLSPSYHVRNFVGNMWNNFLAGVNNPARYIQAGEMQMGKLPLDWKMVDDIGRVWNQKSIMDAAKRTATLNEGWYAADIPTAIGAEIEKSMIKGVNPLSQENYLFRINKRVGTAIENNARLAHFIQKLKEGYSVDQAAVSVKKYLFDYGDLTDFEKKWLKGVAPFYTWTRKNIPLQLEHLIQQPGKYAGLEKVVRALESYLMGDATPANEKYLNDYIRNNTAMRVKYNAKDKTYYYFLLGAWMPSYQMMDFLANPLQNIMQMLTPILKTPMEVYVNKSTFFRNTLGDQQIIEQYPGEFTSYLGFNMPKKTAAILRNIRLLNELDKLNPGKIFGGERGQESIWSKMNLPAKRIKGIGIVSPSKFKYGAMSAKPNVPERAAGFLFGKVQSYKTPSARGFYQANTESRIEEMKRGINKAAQAGDTARVKLLTKEMTDFIKARGN